MGDPKRFRLSGEVQAVQWRGDNAAEMEAFAGPCFDALTEPCDDDPDATAAVLGGGHSTWKLLYTGDWVTRGASGGEFYAVRQADFEAMYVEVVAVGTDPSAQLADARHELDVLRGINRDLQERLDLALGDLGKPRHPTTRKDPMTTIVFMDTETTGLSPEDHIWEWAAIRREADGTMTAYHCFVEHDLTKAKALPESFRADHDARYDPDSALGLAEFVELFSGALAGQPHVIGAVPNFDTERLARILAHYDERPMWHYHLKDIENLAIGYLLGRASMGDVDAGLALGQQDDSDALSRACGVEPPTTDRHTAMGDVRWAIALYDAIGGTGAAVT